MSTRILGKEINTWQKMYKKIPSVYMCVYVCMYMVGLGFYVIKIPAEYLKVEIILSQLN